MRGFLALARDRSRLSLHARGIKSVCVGSILLEFILGRDQPLRGAPGRLVSVFFRLGFQGSGPPRAEAELAIRTGDSARPSVVTKAARRVSLGWRFI